MSGPKDLERAGREHARARELAAARPDGFLTADETRWLDAHLAGCGPCQAVAAQIDAQGSLFDAARGVYPEPPRDLWARTSAAIDAEGGSRPAHRRVRRLGFRSLGSWSLAPLAAVMVVAIAVGAGMLNGLPMREPTSKGEEPDATPFALAAAEIRVLSQGEDGSLEFRRQVVSEVCPVASSSCTVRPTPEVTQTERIAGASAWDAIISPANDQLVVVEKGDGAQGVFVVPLRDSASAASPRPIAPTAPPATASPTERPAAATPSPSPVVTPTPTPADTATGSPDASPSADASDAPTAETSAAPATADATASPEPTVEPTPDTTPEATPAATPSPTATPAASPTVAVTPRPDGAIEIASNVSIVGSSAAYSPDGSHFAFTARPIDGSRGPDVYVWRAGDREAVAITTDHASLFAGWLGRKLLVSRALDQGPRTFIVDLDGNEASAHAGAMWRPAVAPDGQTGAWWDGSVRTTTGDDVWVPDSGKLVLDAWPDGGDARQVLSSDDLTDWQVRWDEKGSVLAVWTTTKAPGKPGTLSLYSVDPKTGLADLSAPKLDAAPAFEGFSLKSDRLTWSAPADGGDTTVQVLAWSGDKVGRIEILAEDGTTVVR